MRVLLVLGLLALASCTPAIVVADQDGVPIEGARVEGISISTNGQWTTTNGLGQAEIPRSFDKTRWIMVSKRGYTSVSGVDVNQDHPIRVTLVKN